jgi:hypothetical protein
VEHNAKPQKPEELSPFERFWDLARRIIAVPKAEIDEQEAEYKRNRAKRKMLRPGQPGR